MRAVVSYLLAIFAAAPMAWAGELKAAQGPVVPDEYIVELAPGALSSAAAAGQSRAALASDVARAYGGRSLLAFQHVLDGFAVRLPAAAAQALANDPRVAVVHPVARFELAVTQSNAPWHLDRVDQRDRPLNTTYNYNFNGAGVHVYIIDTGLRSTHTEFTGRVGVGRDMVGDGRGTSDECGGHGTFVAGIAAGRTYGAAKGATVHAIRVFDCNGGTTSTRVLGGLDWVVTTAPKPAVVNMSLKGGPDSATDTGIRNATNANVVVVVAAGNANVDACGGSPSREPAAITVGASDRNDVRSSFSDWGTCVDLFAPGSSLTSSANSGDTATTTASGTSASSPVVAGITAIYRQQFPGASASSVQTAIKNAATTGRLTNIGTGSPNRLAYSLFGTSPTPTPTPTPSSPNLALNRPATSSTPCNSSETAAKAFNGSVTGGTTDKWCSLASSKWLQVDLGSSQTVSRFVLKHAGAGGESTSWNTRAFNVQTSTDLSTWTTVVTVTANTASTSSHTITARSARYVRLNVTTPTQTTDPAARLYEMEVYR